MSILIKGMDMPSCCMFCPVSNSAGCGLSNPPIIMTSKEMLAGRPDWCPLVPVPPHGRLIDAEAFIKDECNNCDGACDSIPCNCLNCTADCRCDFIKDIADAPTIIPARRASDA